jgi:hypothetical protein
MPAMAEAPKPGMQDGLRKDFAIRVRQLIGTGPIEPQKPVVSGIGPRGAQSSPRRQCGLA